MAGSPDETHFGYQRVPLKDKQDRVDEVFHSVARRYDLMNDLMSGGLHRAWKDALVTAVNPPQARTRRSRCSILPAAPATSPSAWWRPAARTPASRSATSMPICSRWAPSARWSAAMTTASLSSRAMPRSCAYPDRSFDCVTIAFGIRNVPRIERALSEAFRVLKLGGRFLCLEFSAVDVPGLDALYERYSFNVIPAIGKAVTGDREAYQYLVEIDPQVSQAEGLRANDGAGRLSPRLVHAHDRRRGGAAFGLEVVMDVA